MWLYSSGASAQSNFTMSGALTDVGNDSILVEYVERNPDKKIINFATPVNNGHFNFSLYIDKAYQGSLRLKSSPKKVMYFFFVPNEFVNIEGDFIDEYSVRISGSAFYQQYAKVTDVGRSFHKEFDIAQKEYEAGVAAGDNAARLDSIRKVAIRDINRRMYPVVEEYIVQHPDEDATATLVLDVNMDRVVPVIRKLSPAVRNGRFKGYLDMWQEAFERMAVMRKAQKEVADTAKVGAMAPDFSLTTPQGDTLTLSSLRGKYVLLDFWGSWCTWCIKGFPKMKECYAQYGDRIEFVGIDCNDKAEKWKQALEKYQLPWPQVRDGDAKVETAYRVKGYPYKVLIGPDGKILKTYLGEVETFYAELGQMITSDKE
ncbi:hypothetical protein JCM15640A_00560 [Hoylesella timonensis 4401737 = DSM 22865 = JCM 15640]